MIATPEGHVTERGGGSMDLVTYAAESAVLAGMTLVATYLPAHRASRIDPVVALRAEA